MMRIDAPDGQPIETLDDWARLYDSPRGRVHWKEHRSAHSIARFLLENHGAERLRDRITTVVGEPVTFSRAIPEHETRFDDYGRGRMHDVAIFGSTASGRSVFVGVEAKVDEPFGATVGEAYLQAKAKEIAGVHSNAGRRIERLLQMTFREPDSTMFEVRYQLLYATAGTVAAGADVSVLFVAVFRTPLYDEVKGRQNLHDYRYYMEKASAELVDARDDSALVTTLQTGGRRLYCIHEYF